MNVFMTWHIPKNFYYARVHRVSPSHKDTTLAKDDKFYENDWTLKTRGEWEEKIQFQTFMLLEMGSRQFCGES